MNERKFISIVKKVLKSNHVKYKKVSKRNRKIAKLSKPFFLFFNRKAWQHKPDLLISEEYIPCEVKSPKEIYCNCKYSRSHLFGFLLNVIYGQCLSYADLFRHEDRILTIYLIIPQYIPRLEVNPVDIEIYFKSILGFDFIPLLKAASLKKVTFSSPGFGEADLDNHYSCIGTKLKLLSTRITYIPV